ncbi:MAG: extracellular solute-binding protein [Chloroflexi bacterium]|nr:extracellular solute-binding protein [Chloroflexota bacterium]
METHASLLSRRHVVRGWGLATAGLLLAACGGAPASPTAAPKATAPTPAPTPAPAAKPAEPTKPAPAATTAPAAQPTAAGAAAKPTGVELRLHVRTGAEEDTLKEVLPAFTQQTGIGVKLEAFPGGEYYTKLQTLIAGGQYGDVIWTVNYRGTFLWAYNKLIRPLDDLVKADGFDTAQYVKAAWDGAMYEGKPYGMPFKIHPGPAALYYNVNALSQAGLKMPDKQMPSWEELIKLGKALHKESSGRVERFGFYHGMSPNDATGSWKKILMYTRSFGGEIYSEDGKKALLNEPAAKEAIRFLHGLIFKEKIAPSLRDSTAAADDLFISERTALYQQESSTKSIPTRIKDKKFEVRNVIMPPGPSGKVGTMTIIDHIVMSANTKTPKESWELIKLLCGKEIGIRLGEGRGGASGTSGGRLDVLTDARLTSNPLHPIFIDLLQQAQVTRLAYNFRDEELNTVFHQVTGPIWLGEKEPTDAFFKEFNDAVQATLDKPRP